MSIDGTAPRETGRGLAGKVAVVTGAAEEVGVAVATRFAEYGMKLVLTELTDAVHPVSEDLARRYPESEAVSVVTDVTDPVACDALIATAVSRHGRLDVLAHATRMQHPPTPTVELDPQVWDRMMAVNATGPFLLSRAAIPALTKPGGAIVFTGSFAGERGLPLRASYSASKGALRLFTQSLALELAEAGIRVNAVAPAYMESEMGRKTVIETATREGISVAQAQANRDAGIPLGRQAHPLEIADAFVYLASPAAAYITGTWLDINGGVVLR